MTKARADCKAYQASDQMYCPHCHLVWDVNDPDPPPCKIEQSEREKRDEHKPGRLWKPLRRRYG